MAKTREAEAPEPLKLARVRSAGFGIIRTPLLTAGAFAPEGLAGPDRLAERTKDLFAFVKTSPVWEALSTASPSLAKAIDAPRQGQERSAVATAVMRYVERMRGRPTPFGLCAGYTIVPSGPESVLPVMLPSSDGYAFAMRLDVNATLIAAKACVVDTPERRPGSAWCATREVVYVGDTAKVSRRAGSGIVSYADVERTEALDAVMTAASQVATWNELMDALLPFATESAAREGYLHRLIDEGLLVPPTYPSISTDDELSPLDGIDDEELRSAIALARKHRRGTIAHGVLEASAQLNATFASFNRRAKSDEPDAKDAGASPNVALAPDTPDASPKAEMHCIFDLIKPVTAGVLGEDFYRTVERIAAVQERFCLPFRDGRFDGFARFLMERYEGREVPLAEALDPEYGYDFPVQFSAVPVSPADELLTQQWRFDLYSRAIASGTREIVLQESDLPKKSKSFPAVAGYSLFARLSLQGTKVVFSEPRLVGAPGTGYFARATGILPELRDLTTRFLSEQAKANPDVDLAQLTYFLPGKSAAFVQYPVLAPFEVVLAATPGADESRRIDVNDLLVGTDGTEVVLRSKKTGRRVMMVAPGAANPNRDALTGLARFLMTQQLPVREGGFSWGDPYEWAPFLPRVTFEGHTLSLARWRLTKRDTAPVRAAKSVEERWRLVQELRGKLGLPRHVVFSEFADHTLPIDLDDVLSVEAWLSISKDEMLLLEQETQSAIHGPDGVFHHEGVFPVIVPSTAKAADKAEGSDGRRHAYDEHDSFDFVLPGDSCLYIKVYGARSELTALMSDPLFACAEGAREANRISHWFFLPFTDPEPHIRIRLFGEPEELFGRLLPEIRQALAPYLAKRVIRKVDVATYERETYRYGGEEGMNLCERVFCASSAAAVKFFDEFDGDLSSPDDLIVPLVRSTRAILALSGLGVPEQRHQLVRTGASYTRTADHMVPKRAAGELFRKLRTKLMAPVEPTDLWGEALREQVAGALRALKEACDQGRVKRSYEELLADILHVHSVRILTTWCEVANLEATSYFVAEKVLAAEEALALAHVDRKS